MIVFNYNLHVYIHSHIQYIVLSHYYMHSHSSYYTHMHAHTQSDIYVGECFTQWLVLHNIQ